MYGDSPQRCSPYQCFFNVDSNSHQNFVIGNNAGGLARFHFSKRVPEVPYFCHYLVKLFPGGLCRFCTLRFVTSARWRRRFEPMDLSWPEPCRRSTNAIHGNLAQKDPFLDEGLRFLCGPSMVSLHWGFACAETVKTLSSKIFPPSQKQQVLNASP